MAERISTPGGARLLGERIARARKRLGQTQGELGENAGVERSVISKLEAGRFETLSGSVQKVCEFLGLDPRNPDGGARLDSLLLRLRVLSTRFPQLLNALDSVLDAFELLGDPSRRPQR